MTASVIENKNMQIHLREDNRGKVLRRTCQADRSKSFQGVISFAVNTFLIFKTNPKASPSLGSVPVISHCGTSGVPLGLYGNSSDRLKIPHKSWVTSHSLRPLEQAQLRHLKRKWLELSAEERNIVTVVFIPRNARSSSYIRIIHLSSCLFLNIVLFICIKCFISISIYFLFFKKLWNLQLLCASRSVKGVGLWKAIIVQATLVRKQSFFLIIHSLLCF